MLDGLLLGFSVALSFTNLLYCLFGVLIGTLVGILPGISPLVTLTVLLPITFVLDPTTGLILLAGIFYGASYGGSTTAILVNLPGETSSLVTCLDGHQMARQGRAGPALGISAIGSFVGGTIGTLVIALFAPPLTQFALKFGPAEYFSLMILGLTLAVILARGSLLKAIAMILLGVLLSRVGFDSNSGVERLTFGLSALSDGISFVAIAIGIFGFADIVANLSKSEANASLIAEPKSVLPSWPDLRASALPILRGTALGSLLGILPGGGPVLGSFTSYALEKRLAKDPRRFGNGAIEGVAGPETANNAGAQTSFIPLLTLGLPSNAVMALILGAMIVQGITPGPQVITRQPDLFWGLVVSMWLGNLALLILNLPLIGIWVRLLRVPYRVLYPTIMLFGCVGVYSANLSWTDLLVATVFGLIGCAFIRLRCEPAPFVLGFILGPMLEENLRRALLLSQGNPSAFLSRPLSASMLVLAVALLALTVVPQLRTRREEAFQES